MQAFEKQRQVGIDIVSDGELRRGSWLTDMADAVEGFVPQRVELEWKGPGAAREGSTALAAGAKLKKLQKLTAHELPFIKNNSPGPFKVTVPAPSNFVVASYKTGVTDRFENRLRQLTLPLRLVTEFIDNGGERAGLFQPGFGL